MKQPATLAEWAATQKPAKRNKFGVAPKPDRTWRGVVYDSKREMQEAQSLEARVERGEIMRYERQVTFPLSCNGVRICKHVVDFVIHHELGRPISVLEVKGMETKEYKLKRKLFAACYPDIEYAVVT